MRKPVHPEHRNTMTYIKTAILMIATLAVLRTSSAITVTIDSSVSSISSFGGGTPDVDVITNTPTWSGSTSRTYPWAQASADWTLVNDAGGLSLSGIYSASAD